MPCCILARCAGKRLCFGASQTDPALVLRAWVQSPLCNFFLTAQRQAGELPSLRLFPHLLKGVPVPASRVVRGCGQHLLGRAQNKVRLSPVPTTVPDGLPSNQPHGLAGTHLPTLAGVGTPEREEEPTEAWSDPATVRQPPISSRAPGPTSARRPRRTRPPRRARLQC